MSETATDNTSSLPPAAKAASDAAVRAALKETTPSQGKENDLEEGEIVDTKPTSSSAGDEQVTVFHDAENFNVVHPLFSTW
jgi:hypothetical protein